MKTGILMIALYAAIIIIPLVGWVKCIIKLANCDFEPSYKAEVLYTVGTFTGLGVVIGYLDLGK